MSKPKILIFGGSGMLGKHLVAALEEYACEVTAPAHTQVDLSDTRAALEVVTAVHPDTVINCAGLPRPRAHFSRLIQENAVNALNLWDCIRDTAHYVHISTDCVFSGSMPFPNRYASTAYPDPVDYYGRSKLLGEPLDPEALIIRTSFIGLEHGLMNWFLGQAHAVEGWTKVYWSGSTALAVAQLLASKINDGIAGSGIVHCAMRTPLCKYEVLGLIKSFFGGSEIIPVSTPVINRALLATPGWELPPLHEALHAYSCNSSRS